MSFCLNYSRSLLDLNSEFSEEFNSDFMKLDNFLMDKELCDISDYPNDWFKRGYDLFIQRSFSKIFKKAIQKFLELNQITIKDDEIENLLQKIRKISIFVIQDDIGFFLSRFLHNNLL